MIHNQQKYSILKLNDTPDLSIEHFLSIMDHFLR